MDENKYQYQYQYTAEGETIKPKAGNREYVPTWMNTSHNATVHPVKSDQLFNVFVDFSSY
jgi:hypothetical protein